MPGHVYLNDRLVPESEAVVGVTDRGFTLGDGAFETIAVVDGSPRRLERHLARLEAALQVLRFDARPGSDQIAAAVGEIIAANETATGVLRITVTRGAGARGLALPKGSEPTLVVTASEGLPLSDPVSAIICRTTRRNEHSPLSRIKGLGYLDNILALEEARDGGADDAILLNTASVLAGASAANIFIVLGGRLLTPRLEDGALPGLVREDIIAEMDVEEVRLDDEAFLLADEAFLTNSLTIRPLISVDDRPVGDGSAGPITTKIVRLLG